MCGIAGWIARLDCGLDEDALAAMLQAITHRGPDDVGFFEAPGVAFGARRLSIVDVEGGHQPFGIEAHPPPKVVLIQGRMEPKATMSASAGAVGFLGVPTMGA